MTENELHALCDEWKKRLRLQDWHINLAIRRGFEMEDKLGHCQTVLTKKSAWIELLDVNDTPRDLVRPYDPEQTLVHELLHLHTIPFHNPKPESLSLMLEEQMVDALAWTLVDLKRQGFAGGFTSGNATNVVPIR